MNNKIPQKSFDAQMHIIRDVHFDVDKYKVGELYVINMKDPTYLAIQNKIVALLIAARKHELEFRVLVQSIDKSWNVIPDTFKIGVLKLSIDDIINSRIEIERLMTETEAAIYLMGAVSKECAKDIIPEPSNKKPALADKYKGDLSWVSPLLGIDGYHKELLQQHTKNDDNHAYYVEFENHKSTNLFDHDGKFNTDAFRGCKDYKRMNISFIKGDSKFDVKMSTSNLLSISTERLHFGNKACCAQIDLFANSARDMFDEIIIKFIQ